MNEGINIIVVMSKKVDNWRSVLHSRFVHGTKWIDINSAVDNIVEGVGITGRHCVRYFPIHDGKYTLGLDYMWNEGLTATELQEYLDD